MTLLVIIMITFKRLAHLEKGLSTVDETSSYLSQGPDDVCLLYQYEKQVCDLKAKLFALGHFV